MIERHRRRGHVLIARALAVRGAAMIADHPQHHFAVFVVAREGAELGRHFGRGRVADAGHDGGQRGADRAAGFRSRRGCPTTSEARRHWRSRAPACGSRRSAARSRAKGIAPSSPRFRARWSTAASRARSPRCRRAAPESPSAAGREWKARRFSDARLQAVSSRNMYSEHGLEARIGPDAAQVCQSLIVVWNCRPGSALAQAA